MWTSFLTELWMFFYTNMLFKSAVKIKGKHSTPFRLFMNVLFKVFLNVLETSICDKSIQQNDDKDV